MQLPADFIESIKDKISDRLPQFLASFNQPTPVSIRLNPFKLIDEFQDLEQVPWNRFGRYLPERPIFTLDPLFHAGTYYVQEASSMFLLQAMEQVVDFSKPLTVLDLCAAPGGKTTILASVINNESLLVANEVIRTRIAPLKHNLEKWGTSNYITSNHDPTDFEKLEDYFDVVLVDAPCSGEGLFRKDANALNEWSLDHVRHCAARQGRILESAMKVVKSGGILIYSTCTYNEYENDGIAKRILESDEFESISLKVQDEWEIEKTKFGYQFFPHRVKGEGFFLSVFRKKTSSSINPNKVKHPEGLLKPRKEKLSELKRWILNAEEFSFYEKPTGEIIALPKSIDEQCLIVASKLKRRSIGFSVGTVKGKGIVPSPQLALSLACSHNVPFVELTKDQALDYLKKNVITDLHGNSKGWHLAKYEGHGLGWMKILDNRINNYFPNDWRIRMDIVE